MKELPEPSVPLQDPLNREFARLLTKSGWSQADAARQLALTPAAISRYLSGETRPSLTIIRLFKLMVGDLSDGPKIIEPPSGERPLLPLDTGEEKLIMELRRLGEADRRKLIQQFRSIVALIPNPPMGGGQ